MSSAEQDARDMLERLGVEGAQSYSAGELGELANLIAEVHDLRGQVKAKIPSGREYAVVIPDRGYADWQNDSGLVFVSSTPVSRPKREAERLLDATVKQYRDMGCRDIAGSVQLVSRTRTVNVDVTDWEDVPQAEVTDE